MVQIIKGLYINLAIITSMIMFGNMLMREKYISLTRANIIRNGVLSGLLGCLLMFFSVPITNQVFIDFRSIPVLIMALYVSPLAAMEAAIIIGLYRLLFYGVNEASVIAVVVILIVGVVSSLISRMKISIRLKWLLMVGLINTVTGLGIYTVISDQKDRWLILMAYWTGMILASVGLYFFMTTLTRFNSRIDRFKEEAERDYLTGLKTPRHFSRSIRKQLNSTEKEDSNVAMLYIDIDEFKTINDVYGHASGDMVLKEFGKILKHIARGQDVISRKGGDEFTMLLMDCTKDQAKEIAERIRHTIEKTDFKIPNGRVIRITASIGVAAMPITIASEAELLELADKAMYRAKQGGRNRTVAESDS